MKKSLSLLRLLTAAILLSASGGCSETNDPDPEGVGKPGRRIRAISAAVNKIFIEIVVSNEQNDQYTYKTLHNSQKIR